MNKKFKANAKAVAGQARVCLTILGTKYELSINKTECLSAYVRAALKRAYVVTDQLRFSGWYITEGGNYFTMEKGDFRLYIGRYTGSCSVSNYIVRGGCIAKTAIRVTNDDKMCAVAANWANRALGGAPPARLVRS